MKKLVIIAMTYIVLGSCASSIPKHRRIVYLFPTKTEKVINDFLKEREAEDVQLYFTRDSKSSSILVHVELLRKTNNKTTNFNEKGNRFLLINGKHIPVVFDYDYNFSAELIDGIPQVILLNEEDSSEKKVNIPSLEYRVANEHLIGYSRIDRIMDISSYIIIDNKGNILENRL